jgi:hypothetical protein
VKVDFAYVAEMEEGTLNASIFDPPDCGTDEGVNVATPL